MKKITLILCILLAVALMLFGGYKIAGRYIEDKAVKALLENRIEDMLDSGEITLDELGDTLADEDEETAKEAEKEEEAPEKTEPSSDETDVKESQNGNTVTTPDATNKNSSTQTREEIVKETTEKIEKKISRADKKEMMRLIGSKLTSADVNYLAGLLKGGLTSSEISAAKKLAFSRFTKKELEKLHDFYHKYIGLIKAEK